MFCDFNKIKDGTLNVNIFIRFKYGILILLLIYHRLYTVLAGQYQVLKNISATSCYAYC